MIKTSWFKLIISFSYFSPIFLLIILGLWIFTKKYVNSFNIISSQALKIMEDDRFLCYFRYSYKDLRPSSDSNEVSIRMLSSTFRDPRIWHRIVYIIKKKLQIYDLWWILYWISVLFRTKTLFLSIVLQKNIEIWA